VRKLRRAEHNLVRLSIRIARPAARKEPVQPSPRPQERDSLEDHNYPHYDQNPGSASNAEIEALTSAALAFSDDGASYEFCEEGAPSLDASSCSLGQLKKLLQGS
jgi:hypothetical protein